MIALNPNAPFNVQLEQDRGEPKTIFICCQWTLDRERKIKEAFDVGRYEGVIETLRQSLRGWRHMKDGEGRDIAFDADKEGMPTDATLERIPFWAKSALSTKIADVNGITPPEVGKSAPSQEGDSEK